jgi:hypothetical protein
MLIHSRISGYNCCRFHCSGFLTVSPEEIPGRGRAEHMLPGGRSPQLLPPPVRQEADEGVERAGQHQPVRRVVALGRELDEEGEGHALTHAGLVQPPTEMQVGYIEEGRAASKSPH